MSADVGQCRPRASGTSVSAAFLDSSQKGLSVYILLYNMVASSAEGTEIPTQPDAAAATPAHAAADAPSVPEGLCCKLCARTLPASSPGRMRNKTWTCRHCLSLEMLLYRHLGPSEKQGWSIDSRTDFYRRSTAVDVAGCTWSTVKTMIVESQATRLVKEQENRVTAKSLPLSVWVKKGYDEEAVKKYPAEEDENLGKLYAVPVKSVTMKEARQLIEEELQTKEKEVLEKNAKKMKRQGDDAGAKEEDEWDVVPHISAAGGGQPKGKKAKTDGNTAAASAKAAKSAAKATVSANKANEQLTMLASKATGLLSRLLKSTQTLLLQAEKAKLEASSEIEDLKSSWERGTAWNKASVSALPLATAAQGTGARLEALPFTSKDLQDYAKATAGLHKQIREDLKKLKPPKVAASNQQQEMEKAK